MTSGGRLRVRGFTLIELLVVLVVVGLLLGIILTPLSTQFRLRQLRAEQQSMDRIEATLIGFAQAEGRLPCPDTKAIPDGTEDIDTDGTSESCENAQEPDDTLDDLCNTGGGVQTKIRLVAYCLGEP